jgi:hypothetical protein
MTSQLHPKIGRNDPCPCGSGKKYKHCCLGDHPSSSDSLWSRQRDASDHLTREIMRSAARKFGQQIEDAWRDFHFGERAGAFDENSNEAPIFMPYFLFHWAPSRPRRGRKAVEKGGVVARWFLLENANRLSEMEQQILEQAMTRPISFYEVMSTEPGERIELGEVLTGWKTEVRERTASELVRPGDVLYAQVWSLPGITVLGCCGPVCIPPGRKAEIIGLRARLRKRVARQNRRLTAEDIVRYSDEVRATYLNIRDALRAPLRLHNTDGDPLVFHTLSFRIESAEAAFEALAPLAEGRSRDDLLSDAKLDKDGKLRRVEFDWLKRGNRKFSTWDNTILGSIKISHHSLVAEVNSEKRAVRLRKEIEKRLGPSVVHQGTVARTPDELLKNSPERTASRARLQDAEDEKLLRDPEVKQRLQESVQKEAEAWVHRRVPVLGGRTPLQAVQDPDGREIVEALLLQFERDAQEGAFPDGIHPDINAVRRLLNLISPAS